MFLTLIKAFGTPPGYLAHVNSIVVDLKKEMKFSRNGITSRTLCHDGRNKTVLFTFDQGQQLSEHTSSVAASMHFLDGRASVKLGRRSIQAGPGTWVFMKPGLVHAIRAKTRLVMLLTLFDAPHAGRKTGGESDRN